MLIIARYAIDLMMRTFLMSYSITSLKTSIAVQLLLTMPLVVLGQRKNS
jgi:hypothetical protein